MSTLQTDTKGLATSIALDVKNRIIELNMQPGERMQSESELIASYGVSRSTVREAMRLLRAENVIEIKKGIGTFVSSHTGITKDPLGLHFSNQGKVALLEDLLEARLLMEPEIAFLAALRASDQDVQILDRIVRRMMETKVHTEEHTMMDVEFHTAIAQCTHNDVLRKVVPIICDSITEGYSETVYAEGSFERAIKSHHNLLTAIKEKDPLRARYELEKHIRQTLGDLHKMEV